VQLYNFNNYWILIFCPLILVPLTFDFGLLDNHFLLPKAFSMSLLTCLAFIGIFTKKNPLLKLKIDYFALIILYFMIFSALFSKNRYISFNALFTITIPVLFYFATRFSGIDKSFFTLKPVIILFAITLILISSLAILQAYGKYIFIPHWDMRNIPETQKRNIVYSFIGNPNHLANFLIPLIPICLYILLKTDKNFISALYIITIIFVIFACVLTFSRIAIFNLCLLAGVTLFISFKKNIYRYLGISIFLIILSGLILISFKNFLNPGIALTGHKTFLEKVLMGSGSKYKRVVLYLTTLQGILKQPLVGFGPGTFHITQSKLQAQFLNTHKSLQPYFAYAQMAHCDFLQYAFEFGLTAGLTLFFIMISIIYYSYKNEHYFLGTSFLAYFIQACFSFPLFLSQSSLWFYFLCALTLNKLQKNETLYSRKYKFIILFLCMLMIFISIVQYAPRLYSSHILYFVRKNKRLNTFKKITLLQKAAKLSSFNSRINFYLGRELAKAKKFNQAASAFKNYIRFYNDITGYNNFAICLLKANKQAEAIKALKNAIYMCPINFKAMFILATIMNKNGNVKKAKYWYKRILNFKIFVAKNGELDTKYNRIIYKKALTAYKNLAPIKTN